MAADVLRRIFSLPESRSGPVEARVRQFSREGGFGKGTRKQGQILDLDGDDLFRLVAGFALADAGVPMATAIRTVAREWSLIREGFARAAGGAEAYLVFRARMLA